MKEVVVGRWRLGQILREYDEPKLTCSRCDHVCTTGQARMAEIEAGAIPVCDKCWGMKRTTNRKDEVDLDARNLANSDVNPASAGTQH